MPIEMTNDVVTIRNDAGNYLECRSDANGFVISEGDCKYHVTLGEAQTLGIWMLAKIDDSQAALS
jgi:hypothetical protein